MKKDTEVKLSLIAPRYELIALIPFIDYEVGKIFQLTEMMEGFKKIYPESEHFFFIHTVCEDSFQWFIADFDQFPHLFKKLNWWHKRSLKEMPDYIKSIHDNIPMKVEWETGVNNKLKWFAKNGRNYISDDFLPSTKKEYLAYLKNLSK